MKVEVVKSSESTKIYFRKEVVVHRYDDSPIVIVNDGYVCPRVCYSMDELGHINLYYNDKVGCCLFVKKNRKDVFVKARF